MRPRDLLLLPLLAACASEGRIETIAGRPGAFGFDGDGPARDRLLYFPSALAWSPDGALVVDDFNNNRIRALDDAGDLVTIAGVGLHGWAEPGPALDSPLENPLDVAFGPDGALVIAELHTARILSVSDGVLAILAGSGEEGFSGDGGPATEARLHGPTGVAVGADGAVYVADGENHVVRVVRDGVIDVLVGDGTAGVDDGAGRARLDCPQRLHVDGDRLLVADTGNHLVRAVDLATGDVTTIAGTGAAGFSGDGGPATEAALDQPYGVAVTPDGAILVAELGNNRVRRVDADGTITTFAGTGAAGFSGDKGPAVDAALNGPADVLVGPDGAVYVADMLNSVVRRIAP